MLASSQERASALLVVASKCVVHPACLLQDKSRSQRGAQKRCSANVQDANVRQGQVGAKPQTRQVRMAEMASDSMESLDQ